MESQGRKEREKKSKNNSENLLRTYYENHSIELKFIVPWIQYDNSNLKNCKHLNVTEKD